MHPALSVIFFTSSSGAGYGLLCLLGLGYSLGLTPDDSLFYLGSLVTATILIVAGLVSSTFHLGHPERAWRALSQWRSSWLSREGVAALLGFVPLLAFAASKPWQPTGTPWSVIFALLMLLCSLLTVYCTAMIYASLKTVHAWSNQWVVPAFTSLALMSGAILLHALLLINARTVPGMPYPVLLFIVLAMLLKIAYWNFIDSSESRTTIESATGLGSPGKIKLVQSPHSQANYLMKEMGYQLARRHAGKLRRLSMIFTFVLPFLLVLLTLSGIPSLNITAALLSVISIIPGILIERWLFFAEARHTVMLYYGSERA